MSLINKEIIHDNYLAKLVLRKVIRMANERSTHFLKRAKIISSIKTLVWDLPN